MSDTPGPTTCTKEFQSSAPTDPEDLNLQSLGVVGREDVGLQPGPLRVPVTSESSDLRRGPLWSSQENGAEQELWAALDGRCVSPLLLLSWVRASVPSCRVGTLSRAYRPPPTAPLGTLTTSQFPASTLFRALAASLVTVAAALQGVRLLSSPSSLPAGAQGLPMGRGV